MRNTLLSTAHTTLHFSFAQNFTTANLLPLLHSMGLRPLVSNAPSTIRLRSDQAYAMMLRVCYVYPILFFDIVHSLPARPFSPVSSVHGSEHHIVHQPVVVHSTDIPE